GSAMTPGDLDAETVEAAGRGTASAGDLAERAPCRPSCPGGRAPADSAPAPDVTTSGPAAAPADVRDTCRELAPIGSARSLLGAGGLPGPPLARAGREVHRPPRHGRLRRPRAGRPLDSAPVDPPVGAPKAPGAGGR